MFPRCIEEFMNARWMLDTLGPDPTFSPSDRQQQTRPPRLLVWNIARLRAIRAAVSRATPDRSDRTEYDDRPLEARAELMRETNSPSPGPATATGAAVTPTPSRVAAQTTSVTK